MTHSAQFLPKMQLCYYSQTARLSIALIIATVFGLSGCQKTNTEVTTSTPETTDKPVAASVAAIASSVSTTAASTPSAQPNTDQQVVDSATLVQQRLAAAIPEISYTTDNLSAFAQKVNQASYMPNPADISTSDTTLATSPSQTTKASAATSGDLDYKSNIDYTALRQKDVKSKTKDTASFDNKIDEATVIKIQALLNWHGHSVGAVNGTMNKNVIKAMQIFQQKHQLAITNSMNDETWQALIRDAKIANQPVLVNYQLTRQDLITTSKPRDMQYRSAREAVAEKFHMSQQLVSKLNPDTPLKVGNIITVYNPAEPHTTEITKVVSDKKKNILYAYNATGELIASYPTTVGSHYTPSPSGNLVVINRVLNPTYNPDFSSTKKLLPPGPNNPVGRVWIGLSKRSFGIHGSPEPEMISQQKSHGCVRLTNWDALELYSTIADGAEVVFL